MIKSIFDATYTLLKTEIQSAEFISIILNESVDISLKNQLSVVFRYTKESEIIERFIKFIDVSEDCMPDWLFREIETVIEEFNISGKLIGLTYDGAPWCQVRKMGCGQKLEKNMIKQNFLVAKLVNQI